MYRSPSPVELPSEPDYVEPAARESRRRRKLKDAAIDGTQNPFSPAPGLWALRDQHERCRQIGDGDTDPSFATNADP